MSQQRWHTGALVEEFFRELDGLWPERSLPKIELKIMGSSALMLQCGYERGTKDSDVFETRELTSAIRMQLLALAGPSTELHRRRRMYLDIVSNGIPFLPGKPLWHPVLALADLAHLDVQVLDVVDVVVTKLKRFNVNDVSDIDAMCERHLVPHEVLVERFRSALEVFRYDARAHELPGYVGNLHRVESQLLHVDETNLQSDLDSLKY
ncbi:hypothetical protein BH11MYX3_BH11MYX3_14760 [soil metagenome]